MKITFRVLGILIVLTSLLASIVEPVAGVAGFIFGVLFLIRSSSKFYDKINSWLENQKKNSRNKSDTLQEIVSSMKQHHVTGIQKNLSIQNQERMQSSGLKLYEWSTSGDERVCDACKVMDGKLCRWDDATVYSQDGGKTWKRRPEHSIMHPGDHEGCRCCALAYESEIMGEI